MSIGLWYADSEEQIEMDFSLVFDGKENLDSIDEDKILALIEENVDLCEEPFTDIFDAAFEGSYCVNGEISASEAADELFESAEEYINEVGTDFWVKKCDERGKVLQKRKVSLVNILLDRLGAMRQECDTDIRVSRYIQDGLYDFVTSSCWHYGIESEEGEIIEDLQHCGTLKMLRGCKMKMEDSGKVYTPIVWYGLNGEKPAERWTIWDKRTTKVDSFWFAYDSYDVLCKLIPDMWDQFDVWYLGECGYYCPDISELTSECYIEFGEDDNEKVCRNKVKNYFREIFE